MFKSTSNRSWYTALRQILNVRRQTAGQPGHYHQDRQSFRNFSQGKQRQTPPHPPRGRRIDTRVLLAFTSAAGFSFQEHGIPDERIKKAESAKDEFDKRDERIHDWEVLVEEEDFRAFRRRIEGPFEIYEYKCAGTYYDISPRTFLDAQNDIKYRHEWDSNIITLDLLKEQGEHELLRWVSKYPYPMYPREYVYVRRTWVSDDTKVVVVESEVVPEKVCPSPAGSKNVRVASYTSRMAIRAHGEWNQHGLDYILTYSDNPEANIPRYIYNWIVNQGGPYFLKQVHAAAKEIERTGRKMRSSIERALDARRFRDDSRLVEETVEVKREEPQEKEESKEQESAARAETDPNVSSPGGAMDKDSAAYHQKTPLVEKSEHPKHVHLSVEGSKRGAHSQITV